MNIEKESEVLKIKNMDNKDKKYLKPPCLNCKYYAGKCWRPANQALKCSFSYDYPLYIPIRK